MNGTLARSSIFGEPVGLYAPPQEVAGIEDCFFYHTQDVPGHGLVHGQWDLRARAQDYYGHLDFRGKRVLELGTSSGFGAFTMEQAGAEVVAYDLSPDHSWDIVPFFESDPAKRDKGMRAWIGRVNNAFWFCHRAHRSRVKVVYGTAYTIPEAIGPVDIATVCSILLHLRDPFLALQNVAKLVTDIILVTDVIPQPFITNKPNQIVFLPGLPSFRAHKGANATWWYLPPETIQEFLTVLGFPEVEIRYHKQLWHSHDGPYIELPCYTVIGRRSGARQS